MANTPVIRARIDFTRQLCQGFLRLALLVMGGTGCVAHGYYPRLVNAPILTKKGDTEIVGRPDQAGGQISLSRAISDHVSLRADGDAKLGNVSADAGIGVFKTVPSNGSFGLRIAGALDVGMGRVRQSRYDQGELFPDQTTTTRDWHYWSDYRRTSAQVESGLVWTGGSALLFVTRVTNVAGTFGWSYRESSSEYGVVDESTEKRTSFTLVEPAFVARLGLDARWAVELQAGDVGMVTGGSDLSGMGLRHEIVALGLVGRF